MSVDLGRELLVLGLLRRSPMSAYSVDRAVRGHAPLYRPLKHGNIYHAVRKLADRGLLLRKVAKTKRGPQDTKIMFRLSAAGERYFREQLEHVILDLQSPDPTLEIAFVLLGQLPRYEAVRLLRERAQRIFEQEKRLSRIIGDMSQRSAAGFLGLSHTIARLHGERQFLRDSRALVEDAKWHPEWILDDGPIVDPSRSL